MKETAHTGEGAVIWITGLSGAGKSTLAAEVTARLRATGQAVVMLDGDELREVFGAASLISGRHDREARLALAMRYAQLCKVIAQQGLAVVIATISLFKEVHTWNRAHLPRYFEVFLDVPLHELRSRDPKGIYRRFDAGQIENVAGLDLPFDAPESPDVIFEFEADGAVADNAIELVERFMKKKRR